MNSGINLKHVKPSVRPQDDLYRHVNGTWIDSAEIPADRSSDGAFYELYQNAEQHVREIIEALGASGGAKGSVAQKIGDLYGSFMDEAKANALGISTIAKDLELALGVSTVDQFHKVLGDFESRGLGGIFYQYITTDNMDSNTNIGYIDTALTALNTQRATFGAAINRLEYAADNLANVSQNTSASRSRILDADYAAETTELARTQIIQQAGTAMLSQANQQAQSVLALLK